MIRIYIEKYWQDIEGNTPEYTLAKLNEKDYCEAFGFDWNDWQKVKIEEKDFDAMLDKMINDKKE